MFNPFEVVNEPFRYLRPSRRDFELVAANRVTNELNVFGPGAQGLNRMTSLFKGLYPFISELRGTVDINKLPATYTNILPREAVQFNDNIFPGAALGSLNVTRIIF